MDIFGAGMLFALLILIYMGIAEVFTVLFRFTGLPAEKARFQVVSLLTGSGFTTRESELVVSTRKRRKLARITMLFGYVFNITIVSAFVNVFLSLKQAELTSIFWGLPAPIAFFAPAARFGSEGGVGEQLREFRELVSALHQAGCDRDFLAPQVEGAVEPRPEARRLTHATTFCDPSYSRQTGWRTLV